ncbi:MAG: acyl-CoA dehydrogenase family protein [Candidatus Binatia bacterium]
MESVAFVELQVARPRGRIRHRARPVRSSNGTASAPSSTTSRRWWTPPNEPVRPRPRRFPRCPAGFVEQRLLPHAEGWELGRDPAALGLHRARRGGGFLDASSARGRDFGHCVVLAEELPRSRMMGLSLSVLAQATFFTPLLERLGTPEQQAQYLETSRRGERVGALAVTEPAGGSDIVRAVRCTAEAVGDRLRRSRARRSTSPTGRSPTSWWCWRAPFEPSAHGLSLFLVPTDTPGFRVKESLRKLGMHTSPTGWLELDRCTLPKAALLGKRHVGYFYVAQTLMQERLLAAVSAVSAAERVLESTIDHLRGREAYGTRLSKLQAIRHRVVDVAADLEMARRFVHAVSLDFRDGRHVDREICMIKFKVIELVQRAVERCLQLHGGEGFLEDSWVGRASTATCACSASGAASPS